MTAIEIRKIIKLHELWLNDNPEGIFADIPLANLPLANLSGANLSRANLSRANLQLANLSEANLSLANLSRADLSGADLSWANLSEANLSGANLSGSKLSLENLSRANLSEANLSGANLSGADLLRADLSGANLSLANLSGANLSQCTGLLDPAQWLKDNFKFTPDGIIVYKSFAEVYSYPSLWIIESGSIISETVNPNRTEECGCGINFGTIEWVGKNCKNHIWRCLIKWEDVCTIVVPYMTDGKARCGRLTILEPIKTTKP